MIHVVTLEPFEAEEIQGVCRALFAAFGVGSEHVGDLELPDDARDGSKLDAAKLLIEAGPVKTFADDKILFLVQAPFADRQGARGALPTQGYAKYGGDRATASAAGLPADPEARGRALAKCDGRHQAICSCRGVSQIPRAAMGDGVQINA